MNEWKKYRRKGMAEMRPFIPGEDLGGISISKEDVPAREGDMIARNPKNHEDQWLVEVKWFEENFELIDSTEGSHYGQADATPLPPRGEPGFPK